MRIRRAEAQTAMFVSVSAFWLRNWVRKSHFCGISLEIRYGISFFEFTSVRLRLWIDFIGDKAIRRQMPGVRRASEPAWLQQPVNPLPCLGPQRDASQSGHLTHDGSHELGGP